MSNSTLYIDVDQFRKNLAICRSLTSARTLLVVKANAYGHGILPISRIAVESGVHVLGVFNTDELQVLRDAGLQAEVFLLGAVDLDDFTVAVRLGAHVPVWRDDQLSRLDQVSGQLGRRGQYQIKIDTGMGRLGLFPDELETFLRQTSRYRNIECTGIYSHFLGSDLEDLSVAQQQLRTFNQSVEEAFSYGLSPEYVHIANSPAALRLPHAHRNLVRLGVVAYGMPPADNVPVPPGVRAIATWKTKLLNVKTLPAGHGVSYGGEYRTAEAQLVGIIPVGYADGFRRSPKNVNTVIVRGRETRVLGRICMDQAVIDLAQITEARVGDEVVIIGSQGPTQISADTLATRWGTNNYDVVASIGMRVKREYS